MRSQFSFHGFWSSKSDIYPSHPHPTGVCPSITEPLSNPRPVFTFPGARELSPGLRALAALVEDPDSVSSSHGSLQPRHSSHRDPMPTSGLGALHTHNAHTCTQHTQIHKLQRETFLKSAFTLCEHMCMCAHTSTCA